MHTTERNGNGIGAGLCVPEAQAATRAEAPLPVQLNATALLKLLRLASAALPVGAFAYSHGLESAVSLGWVHDAATTAEWVSGLLQSSIASSDVPVMARIYRAFAASDVATARRWNAWLFATRATSELQAEDRQLGTSLARLCHALGRAEAQCWVDAPDTTFCCAFALAAYLGGVDAHSAALGYAAAWCEAQVGAAVRLVPLGQTQGQRVLLQLEPAVVSACATGFTMSDEDMSSSAPGHAMASAAHEVQYSRLFRS